MAQPHTPPQSGGGMPYPYPVQQPANQAAPEVEDSVLEQHAAMQHDARQANSSQVQAQPLQRLLQHHDQPVHAPPPPSRQSQPLARQAPPVLKQATPPAQIPANQIPPGGAPVRRYLNENVTPTLLEGMKMLAREQPKQPLLALARFLEERHRELEQDVHMEDANAGAR